jgi:hypothetical protein
MRFLLLLVSALVLAGCDKPVSKESTEVPAPIGRWLVVSSPSSTGGLHYAWRIDTQTGGLEMCLYALPSANTGGPRFGSPNCSASTAPN